MAYTVKYGSYNLYVPGSDSYAMHGMQLGMRVDQVSTLTFTMVPNHPQRSRIKLHDFANPVTVYYDDTLLFRGYVTRMVTGIDMQVTVTCESDLGMLDMVHVRFTDDDVFTSDEPFAPTAGNVFSWAIACYNSKVPSSMQFTIGHNIGSTVGYTVPWLSKRVVDASTTTPDTALGLITGSVVSPYGCVLKVWYDGSTRYIGIYTAAPDTNSQRIEFGKNMKTYEYDENDEDFHTACYPIGATYKDYSSASNVATWHTTAAAAAGAEYIVVDASIDWVPSYGNLDHDKVASGDIAVIGGVNYRITQLESDRKLLLTPVWQKYGFGLVAAVASGAAVYYKGHSPYGKSHTCTLYDVSNGTKDTYFYKYGPILRHTASYGSYGLDTFAFTDTNIGYGPDLLAKAEELLLQCNEPTITLSADAVDMAMYGNYTHLQAGQRVRVINSIHGVDTTMQVTQADIDLDNPAATRYTLGAYQQSVSRKVKGNTRGIGEVNERMEQMRNDTLSTSTVAGLQ